MIVNGQGTAGGAVAERLRPHGWQSQDRSKASRVLDWMIFPASVGLLANAVVRAVAGSLACVTASCLQEPPHGPLTTLLPFVAFGLAAAIKLYVDLRG